MNKLIKTALLASALGILSVNAYAATQTQWIGEGPWQGPQRGNGMRSAGPTIEIACENALKVQIANTYPGYKNISIKEIKPGDLSGNYKDRAATCVFETIVDATGRKSLSSAVIWFKG